MVTSEGFPLDPSELNIIIIPEFLWVYATFANMLTSIGVKFSRWAPAWGLRYDHVCIIFSFMSVNMYFMMNQMFISRPPGHLQG